MSEDKKSYYLFDRVYQHKVEELNWEEVRLIARSIAPKLMTNWYYKTSQDSQWKPLLEHPEFALPSLDEDMNTIDVFKPVQHTHHESEQSSPTVPSPGLQDRIRVLEDDSEMESNMIPLETRADDSSHGYKARRYNREYKAVTKSGSKSFETKTLNVSVSGLLLEDEIPSWVRNPFKIELYRDEESVLLLCRTLPKDRRRIQIEQAYQPEIFKGWLIAS